MNITGPVSENGKRIVFEGLRIDGRKQKLWFKVFDLFDKIFSDEEKRQMSLLFESSTIVNFNGDIREYPQGTTKRNFAEYVYHETEGFIPTERPFRENREIVFINESDSVFGDEVYTEWYKCTNCRETSVFQGAKFCPDCGKEIKWISKL